jgi:GNAT superfamily N-acetyltransferase
MTNAWAVDVLPPERADDAVGVLCDAFHDYPVMRYVLGPRPDYDRRLRTLVGFFVAARTLRQEPVLGIHDPSGSLAAAAVITPPGDRPPPHELAARRNAVWAELGADERMRYEAYGAASSGLLKLPPQHHLNMIGVRHTHMGRGLARRLIEAVEVMAREDPASAGVSLNTETEKNVGLYLHLGYRLLGRARVAEGVETWGFFRPLTRRPPGPLRHQ